MATAAAALKSRARREIQHHFFAKDAVRADRAVTFTPSNGFERRQFGRMLERGTIQKEGSDRYWIDVVAYDVELRARHRRIQIALVIVIIALAVTVALPAIQRMLHGH
jgi:hypothetical protein